MLHPHPPVNKNVKCIPKQDLRELICSLLTMELLLRSNLF